MAKSGCPPRSRRQLGYLAIPEIAFVMMRGPLCIDRACLPSHRICLNLARHAMTWSVTRRQPLASLAAPPGSRSAWQRELDGAAWRDEQHLARSIGNTVPGAYA